MEFVVGAEGMTSHVVLGSETIMVLVVAQGAVSQIITGVFSRMAVAARGTPAADGGREGVGDGGRVGDPPCR